MQPFTSKQLYMMNGGDKLYIYKDGFGDVYTATAAEEALWTQEVISNALSVIDTEENVSTLNAAIENLRFHRYKGLTELLLQKIEHTSAARQLVFATAIERLKTTF